MTEKPKKPAKAVKTEKKRLHSSRVLAIRWTVEAAAGEFGINPRTLASRVKTHGIEKGKDGRYSTIDIAGAVYDDQREALVRAQTRKNNEEADAIGMANALTRGNLLDLEDFSRKLEALAQTAKQNILEVGLPKEKEEALLTSLSAIFAK